MDEGIYIYIYITMRMMRSGRGENVDDCCSWPRQDKRGHHRLGVS